MRLTLEQDYAIRIVYELCKTTEKVSVSELSRKTGVTPLFIQKIMRKLNSANLVEAEKGTKGGYVLRYTPDVITFYDVIVAISGELRINACLTGEYECNRPNVVKNNGSCVIKKTMCQLNTQIANLLKQITFKNLS